MAYDLFNNPSPMMILFGYSAEQKLKLKNAFDSSTNPLMGNFPEMTSIDPNKIIDTPNADETKTLAELIAKQCPSLENLNSFLAQRVYIVNSAKKDN